MAPPVLFFPVRPMPEEAQLGAGADGNHYRYESGSGPCNIGMYASYKRMKTHGLPFFRL